MNDINDLSIFIFYWGCRDLYISLFAIIYVMHMLEYRIFTCTLCLHQWANIIWRSTWFCMSMGNLITGFSNSVFFFQSIRIQENRICIDYLEIMGINYRNSIVHAINDCLNEFI